MPRLSDMVALMGSMPSWLSLLIVSLAITYTICVFGVAFGKMGRSPYWGLVFLFPFLGTILLWTFGLGRWPQAERNVELESGL
jgi:hypothetical protein